MKSIHLKHCKMDIKKQVGRFTFEVDTKDDRLASETGNSILYFQMIYQNGEFGFPQKENCSNLWFVEKGDIIELPKELYLNRSMRREAKTIGEEYIENIFGKSVEQGKYNLSVSSVKDTPVESKEPSIPFQQNKIERG